MSDLWGYSEVILLLGPIVHAHRKQCMSCMYHPDSCGFQTFLIGRVREAGLSLSLKQLLVSESH